VRPFSAARSGLLLGDGVAAVVLESAERAHRRGADPIARVAGWGMASDAYHIAKPHPAGAGMASAIRQAMRRARAQRVDYVNAHGTGTPLNDSAETKGLRIALGKQVESTPVSSTKSTTGHMLEASGAVEFVISLLALVDGVVPPTAGYTEPDPECDLDYVTDGPRHAELRRVVTLNAAFGGMNTAIVLERP
jgi:3-oxoacyl-[acyl-carrier-protein] synthase II